MTSILTMHQNDQYNPNNSDPEVSSTMEDNHGEKTPLLNTIDNTVRSDSPVSHCHVPDEKFDYSARNRLIFAFVLSLTFMIIEIVGAVLSNSTAIGMDATHMCIDSGSFLISLAAIYLARKRPTRRLSFGYARAEILGALLSVVTIWVATGILVFIAAQRVVNQNFIVKPNEMIIVAACGVVFNIVIFFVLHNDNCCGSSKSHHGHSHGTNHNHSHGGNSNELSSTKNINIRAALIHVVGDFIQSIGVLLAAILIKVNPNFKLADPICTFIFSVLVLITTITIMRDIVLVLMEGVPFSANYTQIIDDLLRLPGVRNAHSLHIWSLSLQKTALSVHIAIDDEQNCLKILGEAQEMLRRDHSITRATIQVEPYNEYIMNSCETCLAPAT